MKIPKDLPQFKEENALLVAASKRQAEMYIAHDHELTKISEIRVLPPQYSDREGFFAKRGGGRTFGTGAVYERQKEKMEHEFIPIFAKAIEDVVKKFHINHIYMFAPAYQQHFIEPALPKTITSKIDIFIKNNLYGRHPKVLLEKLKDHLHHNIIKPTTREVSKILNLRILKNEGA